MMTFEGIRHHLEGLVGPDHIWTDEAHIATHAVAGRQPRFVVQPETATQAAEIVAVAGRERCAVVPWGQGTQMHLGQTPTRYDLALSLARLTRVVDYDSANLTLIAEAGLPLRTVYRLTTPQQQFLPLGHAGTAASLGGLLVTNTSGVKRLRYGGVRDLLLGVRVALPDGALAHFGGRVVKNVAGYDMNKLFIGSLGAFGVVLETTYRLAALPEDDRVLAVTFPTLAQATAAVAALRAAPLLPSAMLLLYADVAVAWAEALPLTVQAPQVVLLLNYDGLQAAVARQIRDSRALCQTHGSLADTTLAGTALTTLWELHEAWCRAPAGMTQPFPATASAEGFGRPVPLPPDTQLNAPPFPATASAEGAQLNAPPSLQVRLGVLPSQLAATLTHLTQAPHFCQQGIAWLADAGHGHIWARLFLRPSEGLGQAVQAWLDALRAQLQTQGGYAVVEGAPAALRPQLDVWGPLAHAPLLSLYKQSFDPYAVLNPGRYVAGL